MVSDARFSYRKLLKSFSFHDRNAMNRIVLSVAHFICSMTQKCDFNVNVTTKQRMGMVLSLLNNRYQLLTIILHILNSVRLKTALDTVFFTDYIP